MNAQPSPVTPWLKSSRSDASATACMTPRSTVEVRPRTRTVPSCSSPQRVHRLLAGARDGEFDHSPDTPARVRPARASG
jgi:hypothetical protein